MLKQVCIRVLSSVRAVNVFKKKRGGASLCKSETLTTKVEMIGTDLFVSINRNG